MRLTKKNIRCSYCGKKAVLTDSRIVYGKSHGLIYVCTDFPNCDSYVGANKRTQEPLGILANKELREWKKKAHGEFDPIWRNKILTRTECYELLAELMELEKDDAHIGYFSSEMCEELIQKIKRWKIERFGIDSYLDGIMI